MPYSLSDLRKAVAGEYPGGNVMQDTRAVVVNDEEELGVTPTDGVPNPLVTGVTFKVVRNVPFPEDDSTYVVDNTGCDPNQDSPRAYDWTSLDGDVGSRSPTVYARFSGSRVVTANQSAFAAGPLPDLAIQPYGCGNDITEWTVRVAWKAGKRSGSTVLGPFRTVPDQGLPEYVLNANYQSKQPLSLAPLNPQHAVRTCRSAPVPDPAHPTAYPHCGAVTNASNHANFYVVVRSGTVSCATAMRIADTYLNDPSYTLQGSSGYEVIKGWECAATTFAEARIYGYAGGCSSGTGDIAFAAS
ncbi:hypothetical protein ACFWOT_34335 [Streptomyces sp. NPDC058440]|uniref:hypothetical protein n=1 Tax=Streptomyces sp. NPDC058440 TaxID=3346501 RepID=UPI003646BDC9